MTSVICWCSAHSTETTYRPLLLACVEVIDERRWPSGQTARSDRSTFVRSFPRHSDFAACSIRSALSAQFNKRSREPAAGPSVFPRYGIAGEGDETLWSVCTKPSRTMERSLVGVEWLTDGRQQLMLVPRKLQTETERERNQVERSSRGVTGWVSVCNEFVLDSERPPRSLFAVHLRSASNSWLRITLQLCQQRETIVCYYTSARCVGVKHC